jgi:hypothetical protein
VGEARHRLLAIIIVTIRSHGIMKIPIADPKAQKTRVKRSSAVATREKPNGGEEWKYPSPRVYSFCKTMSQMMNPKKKTIDPAVVPV